MCERKLMPQRGHLAEGEVLLALTDPFDPPKWARLKKKEAASVDVEFEKGLSQPDPEEQVIQQEAERKQGLESHRWAFQ